MADYTQAIALNKIQQAALRILFEGLNAEITVQNGVFDITDGEFFAAIGQTDPNINAEQIPPDNFYAGHIPSLLKAEISKYPNVACIASQATPQRSTDDWGDMYNVSLAVELMARSEAVPAAKEFQAQLEVNGRIQRMMEAAHVVILENRTLRNTVPRLSSRPTVFVSDAFVRRENTSGTGDKWFWQGARLEYPVEKYSAD